MKEENNVYYKQGFKAYMKMENCAYSPTSTKGELWSMGYHAAQELDSCDTEEDPASLTIDEVNDLT